MTERRIIDLQPLVPRVMGDLGFTVQVGRGVRLSGGGSFYTAEILERRTNANQQEKKGRSLITICGNPDASVSELLHTLANLFDQDAPIVIEEADD